MIHLDTNYLIRSLVAGTAQAAQVDEWINAGETLGISATAWAEFMCGPLSSAATSTAHAILSPIESVTGEDAAAAAEFINKAGRRRGTLADCVIAAVAMKIGASLATDNRGDLDALVSSGLKVVP